LEIFYFCFLVCAFLTEKLRDYTVLIDLASLVFLTRALNICYIKYHKEIGKAVDDPVIHKWMAELDGPPRDRDGTRIAVSFFVGLLTNFGYEEKRHDLRVH